jgi:nucleoside transporter
MNVSTYIRLSAMMFLQFFIWGSWFVTMGTFLDNNLEANGAQIGLAYSTQSWGAILAPFIIGLIADRFFNAERILGVLHLLGGALMFLLYRTTSFSFFYPYILSYMILYMPTLALVNSVAFRQLDDPSKSFSWIRVWGSAGWIIAGLVISFFSWDAQGAVKEGLLRNTFLLGAGASTLLGLFSFTLPKTPPLVSRKEKVTFSQMIGLEAIKLLKDRNYAIFFISSVLICIPLAFYYSNANLFLVELNVENSAGKMTLGQVSEVAFMLLLPIFLKQYGVKKTLLVGMMAWAVRYVFFAYGNEGSFVFMILLGIGLHGVCYDFFFVSGQIYTDSKAGEQYKSAAQGMITLATYGIGMLIGYWAAGKITDQYVMEVGHDWPAIWVMPAGFALIVFFLFAMAFKNEKVKYQD